MMEPLDDNPFECELKPQPEPEPELELQPQQEPQPQPQPLTKREYFELERRGIVGDTWEPLYLQLDPDGRHLNVHHVERPQLIDQLHLPESRVVLPAKPRKGRHVDTTFCLEAWSSGFPSPHVDTDSARLTSITKEDGTVVCGPDDVGWRRGLFELGIVSICVRDNTNPLSVFAHTIEVRTVRAEGKYEFTDATGDTYTKRVLSTTRPSILTLDYNSTKPDICQVALRTKRGANLPKEEWFLSVAQQGVPSDQVRANVLTSRRDAIILGLGRAGATVPSKYAEQLYIEGIVEDFDSGSLVAGWIDVKTTAGWSPGWFELRSSSLSYHRRPGAPADGTMPVDGVRLTIGPLVEEQLGRQFAWRMEQPDVVVGAEHDDDFVLVEESVPLSEDMADGSMLHLMWNGAAVATQVEFDKWTRALSRRTVELTCGQAQALDLEVDALGGIVGIPSAGLAASFGFIHHHIIASVNGIAVTSGRHYNEMIDSAIADEEQRGIAVVLEGVGVFSRCSNIWHQLGGVAFETMMLESVQANVLQQAGGPADTALERLFIRPRSMLTDATMLELPVLFPRLRQLFISSVTETETETETGKPPEGTPPCMLERLSSKPRNVSAVVGTVSPGTARCSMNLLKQRLPCLEVAHLGCELVPDMFDSLMGSYADTKRLDLGKLGLLQLSQPALIELVALCPDCLQIFFPRQVAQLYECVSRATARISSKLDSRRVGRVEVGEVVTVLEVCQIGPTTRMRLKPDAVRSRSMWVSATAGHAKTDKSASMAVVPKQTVLFRPIRKISADQQQTADDVIHCFSAGCRHLQVLHLGRDISSTTFEKLLREYETTKRLDISGDCCAGLTQKGLDELLCLCPKVTQLFSGPAAVLDSVGDVDALKLKYPSLSVAHLGRDISAATFDDLMAQYEKPTATLDMTDTSCADIGLLGMQELCALCPGMRGAVFHTSHMAISREISSLSVVLPGGIKAGETFELHVDGVAEKFTLPWPEDDFPLPGQTWEYKLGDRIGGDKVGSIKQPHSDTIGLMMAQMCPELAVDSGSRIRVRKLRREEAMLMEAVAAPEVGIEVVKSMVKLRDVAAELEKQEHLISTSSAAATSVDCFRCDGTGRVREMRTEVTRAFASEQELLRGDDDDSGANWLFEDELGCWKLYDHDTSLFLEQAWNDHQMQTAVLPTGGSVFGTPSKDADSEREHNSVTTPAPRSAGRPLSAQATSVGDEIGQLPPSQLTVQLGMKEGGRPLWEVNIPAMTQRNLLTGVTRPVKRANEALGQAGHPCWVCRGSGQVSPALSNFDSRTFSREAAAQVDQPCLVCYDDSDYHLTTSCGHTYCAGCIKGTLDAVLESAQFPAWCPQCRVDAIDSGEELTVGRIPPEAVSFLEQRGVITTEFLFRFLKHNEEQNDDAAAMQKTFACPGGCGQYLIEKPIEWTMHTEKAGGGGRQLVRLGLCSCGTPVCPGCQCEVHDVSSHCCPALAQAAPPDPATIALMHKLGKPCPRCSNFIEKTAGCHIMMCGCEAHGRVADALRRGGCAFVFDWNSMEACHDGHGYHDMNGDWKRGEGPLTARQIENPPKCRREGCPFLFHADPVNNGEGYCCMACKEGKLDHDGHCHQLVAEEEWARRRERRHQQDSQ